MKSAWNTDDPDIIAAAERWIDLKPEMDQVKDILQEASDAAGKMGVIAGTIIAGYFHPRNPSRYDAEKLDKLVPADILRRCLLPEDEARESATKILVIATFARHR